jgi:hypothetical protein
MRKPNERIKESIDDEYFRWLCLKILERKGRIYNSLLKILYSTEFVWVVPADSHRAADGIQLRRDFRRETNTELDETWLAQPASLLEVFIAFAIRAEFQTDIPVRKWFWTFMENLHLDQFRQVTDDDKIMINEILEKFTWRLYDSHGFDGGLFPVMVTENDQRERELWYQFSEYVLEQGLV